MMLLLAAACITEIRFPPREDPFEIFDTGPPTPGIPTNEWGLVADGSIHSVCNGSEGLALAFRTIGWADGAIALVVHSARAITEEHLLVRTEVDPGGDFEVYQLGPLVDGVLDWEPGFSTQLNCAHESEFLTIALLTEGRVGGFADCVILGTDLVRMSTELETAHPGVFGSCRLLSTKF